MNRKEAHRLLNRKRGRGRPSAALSKRIKEARALLGVTRKKTGKKLSKRARTVARMAGRIKVDGRPVRAVTYAKWSKKAKAARMGVTAWLRKKGHTVGVLGGRSRKGRKPKSLRGAGHVWRRRRK